MTNVLADLLATVGRVTTDIVEHEAERTDREARWPEASLRALQREGLGGLVIPTTLGGLGQGLFGLAHVCETLGRSCASTAICFGMHQVAAAVIASKPTSDQVERYLAPIIAGEHLTSLALSEPGTGAHFYYPQTRMSGEGDDYRLTGNKAFITNGGHADSYVISARAASGSRAGTFSCALVPNEAPGIAWGEPWNGLGMRGNSARTMSLDDVHVGRRDLLGDEGDQTWFAFQVVAPYFLVAMAGTYLGLASRALDDAVTTLKERRYRHAGAPPAQVGVVQHRVGELWSSLERTRRLVYWAAQEADAGGANTTQALCAAKAEVANCATTLVNECMTLTGGADYRDGSRLSRLLRDARAAHIMSPTTDLLYTWTGRSVLGLPLLDETTETAAPYPRSVDVRGAKPPEPFR